MTSNCTQHSATLRAVSIGHRVRRQIVLSALLLAGACGGGGDGNVTRPVTPVAPDPPVTVTVSPSPLAVSLGASTTLAVSISGGSTASPPTLTTCTSATPGIASVSLVGGGCRVTGVAPGNSTITATVSTGHFASTNVLVMQDALTNLSVAPLSLSLSLGQTATLTPTPTTTSALVAVSYSYASSNVGVAAVAANGAVTGVASGEAIITVTGTGAADGFTTTQRTAVSRVMVTNGTPLGIGFGPEQFASIPAGSYARGSPNGFADEQPVRTITISAFRMQKTEVTQAQWRQVMTGTALANPSSFATCGDTCPVERVSWDDIQMFLVRLNQQDPGRNYRLATEAEWEYAARAGTTGDYGGNGVLDDMGWWTGNARGRAQSVGQKQRNAFGLFDMHGNVWEWVNDSYQSDYYRVGPGIDPPGPPLTGFDRVLRGGSAFSAAIDARSASRGTGGLSNRQSNHSGRWIC
jgi:hypothetical protein